MWTNSLVLRLFGFSAFENPLLKYCTSGDNLFLKMLETHLSNLNRHFWEDNLSFLDLRKKFEFCINVIRKAGKKTLVDIHINPNNPFIAVTALIAVMNVALELENSTASYSIRDVRSQFDEYKDILGCTFLFVT